MKKTLSELDSRAKIAEMEDKFNRGEAILDEIDVIFDELDLRAEPMVLELLKELETLFPQRSWCDEFSSWLSDSIADLIDDFPEDGPLNKWVLSFRGQTK